MKLWGKELGMKYPVTHRPTGNGLEDEFMKLVAELINIAYEDGRAGRGGYPKDPAKELRAFEAYLGRPATEGVPNAIWYLLVQMNKAYKAGGSTPQDAQS